MKLEPYIEFKIGENMDNRKWYQPKDNIIINIDPYLNQMRNNKRNYTDRYMTYIQKYLNDSIIEKINIPPDLLT